MTNIGTIYFNEPVTLWWISVGFWIFLLNILRMIKENNKSVKKHIRYEEVHTNYKKMVLIFFLLFNYLNYSGKKNKCYCLSILMTLNN